MGAGSLCVMDYYRRDQNGRVIEKVPVVILFKERGGSYAHKFNISCGGWEQIDGYYGRSENSFNTMKRELKEEAGLVHISNCVGNSRPPDGYVGPTPVWVLRVPSGLKRADFRPTSEMYEMEYFPVINFKKLINSTLLNTETRISNINNQPLLVSDFTIKTVRTLLNKI